MVVLVSTMLNVVFILSLIGVGLHLCQEYRFLPTWSKSTPWPQLAKNYTPKAIHTACIGLFVIYSLMIGAALLFDSDLVQIIILTAQGSVLVNWSIHVLFKLILKWNMPGFYTATFIMLPPTIYIIYHAFDQWWFSTFLKIEVLFAGVFLNLLVPFTLLSAGRFLEEKKKAQVSDWENIDDEL